MGQPALHKHADPSLQGGLAPANGRRAFAAAFAASGGKARHRPQATTMVDSVFPALFDAANLSRRCWHALCGTAWLDCSPNRALLAIKALPGLAFSRPN
jgi:hypothetical protein